MDDRLTKTAPWVMVWSHLHLSPIKSSHKRPHSSGFIRKERQSQMSHELCAFKLHRKCLVYRVIRRRTIITARKRSLRRFCFYTCLSVILFTGGCLPQCILGYTPPGKQTPPGSRHPGSRHPLESDTHPPPQCML